MARCHGRQCAGMCHRQKATVKSVGMYPLPRPEIARLFGIGHLKHLLAGVEASLWSLRMLFLLRSNVLRSVVHRTSGPGFRTDDPLTKATRTSELCSIRHTSVSTVVLVTYLLHMHSSQVE